jgi:hypothetical protein
MIRMTIKQTANKIKNGIGFWIAFGDFLDEFYRQGETVRQTMIEEEPSPLAAREHKPFLAAAAHKLANDYCLRVPGWVWHQDCYLRDYPFFDCGAKGNLRLLFMYKSPTEFKHRNLFVDENVLSRV